MTHNQNSSHSFHRSQSADMTQPQPRILQSTHSSNTLPSLPISGSFHRTVEGARHVRDCFHNVIRGIEPLVETARTVNAEVSSLLNRPQTELNLNRPPVNNEDTIVINLVPDPVAVEVIGIDNSDVDDRANALNPPNNTENNNASDEDRTQAMVETQRFLRNLAKYVPYILILLVKSLYDYHKGIFILVILFAIFVHSNSVVKKEAMRRQRRSILTLLLELVYISACLVFIHFMFEDDLHNFNVVLNLVLIRTFTHPLSVWNLLWIVIVTDFVLKLFTVTIKILITILPGAILDCKNRGKIYLFIEAVSQLYRSVAAIQPWLYYLLESYQGPEKIVAVFLSALYMISKGANLMSKMRFLKKAFFKVIQNVNIGSSPSRDQIQAAGENCPICHDQYSLPVLLHCRHIFCESCVSTWFDREQSCPLCRAKIVDDPRWRDGSTAYFMQLF